jgi:hypothetical protein
LLFPTPLEELLQLQEANRVAGAEQSTVKAELERISVEMTASVDDLTVQLQNESKFISPFRSYKT